MEKKEKIRRVIQVVAQHYEINPDVLIGNGREKWRTFPKMVAITLGKEIYPEIISKDIAEYFNFNALCNVAYYKKKVNELRDVYKEFNKEYEQLKQKIMNITSIEKKEIIIISKIEELQELQALEIVKANYAIEIIIREKIKKYKEELEKL